MNFYKIAAGLSLALLLSSGFSGCGGSSNDKEAEGYVNQTKKQVADKTGIIDEIIILRDSDGVAVATVTLANTVLRGANKENKCACIASKKCTPCAVTVKRSCGSKAVDAASKTAEVQAGLDDTQLALLSASYTITINRPVGAGDTYSNPIEVSVKVPKCIHDKATDTYFDYKDGEVEGIRVWVQTGDAATDGYWLKDGGPDGLAKTFTPEEIKNGALDFLVNKPGVSITLIGIVKNPSATGATGA